MIFADKLIMERKKLGWSQEQLADQLGVTRQSVSKWESAASQPELGKLVQMSEMFGVSVDYLVKDAMDEDFLGKYAAGKEEPSYHGMQPPIGNSSLEQKVEELASYFRGYSYTSKTKICGIPLVSVRFCRHLGRPFIMKGGVAKGIIAIGNMSVGVVSIGIFSIGGISLGVISLGLLALGVLSMGLVSLGVVGIGMLALGCTVIGKYAGGVAAVGSDLAVGVAAVGRNAIGADTSGENVLELYKGIPKQEVLDFIRLHCPGLWGPVADLLAAMGAGIK